MLHVSVQEFCAPEFLIGEKIVLWSSPAGECEPLHVVRNADVVGRWKIQTGMRGGSWHDCHKMWRKFLRSCPLIKARIRTAPHGSFAVTEWLLRQPFNHVVSVARLICEQLEFTARISAAANIDEREDITV